MPAAGKPTVPHLGCQRQVVLMYSKEFGFQGDMGLNPALATNRLVTRDNKINPSETQFPPPKTEYDNDRHLLWRVVLRRAPLLDKRNKGHEATEASILCTFKETCSDTHVPSPWGRVCAEERSEKLTFIYLYPPFPVFFWLHPGPSLALGKRGHSQRQRETKEINFGLWFWGCRLKNNFDSWLYRHFPLSVSFKVCGHPLLQPPNP